MSDQDLESLARYLAVAYVAYQLGVTFQTAMRRYGACSVDDFWKEIALAVVNHLFCERAARTAEGAWIN